MKVIALSVAGDGVNPAVELAAKLGDCTAVAIAPDTAATALALDDARAAGASQLIHLWDEAFAETERDPLARELIQTTVLAALGRKLESRLFVVPETAYGWLGPALAEELDLPHLTGVIGVTPLPRNGEPEQLPPPIEVRRRCLQGVQRLRGPAMGVLGVLPKEDKKSATATKKSAGSEIETWNLGRLGLGPVDLPRPLLRPLLPERRSTLTVRVYASISDLATRLRQDGLLPPLSGGKK